VSARLLVCDSHGNILDHPQLGFAGQSGRRWVPVPEADLVPIPEGTKVFFVPDSRAVGWDHERGRPVVLEGFRAVAGMLQAGYTRTLLPAAERGTPAHGRYGCHDYLPLWSYAAVGWRGDEMVAAAFRVDPMTHSETEHYDDREIAPRVRRSLREHRDNRLIVHLSRCALEYHCFAAKNFFMGRWEAPLPAAPACNARCLGCISLQPSECCPASQERIGFLPTVEELCGVAVPHLEQVERAIVSFGQGCEGEPLTVADTLEPVVREIRRRTGRGTVHLNTNGSLPEDLRRVVRAGLDSVRISLNSPQRETYDAYYRPTSYRFDDVVESLRVAVGEGVYVALNLLVFPGVTDHPAEVEALERLIADTGLHMVHLRNLSIDPQLYADHLPATLLDSIDHLGLRNLAIRLKRSFPSLDLGYFNRPREDFSTPRVDELDWARSALSTAG
jgi:pyruvate-formate lyase-activating enzyme